MFTETNLNTDALPSFNGSNEYLQLLTFKTAPAVGERYYFDQNSLIDAGIVTALRVHYTEVRFFGVPFDMDATYQVNGVQYDTIKFDDYKNLLLTLADKRNTLRLQRCPASTFLVLPNAPGFNAGAAPKQRKALRLAVSTRQCFIEFTKAPVTRAPFVVPISIDYTTK